MGVQVGEAACFGFRPGLVVPVEGRGGVRAASAYVEHDGLGAGEGLGHGAVHQPHHELDGAGQNRVHEQDQLDRIDGVVRVLNGQVWGDADGEVRRLPPASV